MKNSKVKLALTKMGTLDPKDLNKLFTVAVAAEDDQVIELSSEESGSKLALEMGSIASSIVENEKIDLTQSIELATRAFAIGANPKVLAEQMVEERGVKTFSAERYDPQADYNLSAVSAMYTLMNTAPVGIVDRLNTIAPIYDIGNSSGISIESPVGYFYDKSTLHGNGSITGGDNTVNITKVASRGINTNTTKLYAVRDTGDTNLMVATADVPAKNVEIPGSNPGSNDVIQISPYLFDKEIDYLGIGQTPGSLAAGSMDDTDTIDNTVKLSAIIMKFTDDIVMINTLGLRSSQFTMNQIGDESGMIMHMSETAILDQRKTKVDGAPTTTLAAIRTGVYTVYVELSVAGNINLRKGKGSVHFQSIKVVKVIDNLKNIIAMTDPAVKPFVDEINTGKPVGYYLDMHTTDSNRRSLGTLVGYNIEKHPMPVGVRPPITMKRPVNRPVDMQDINYLNSIDIMDRIYETGKTLHDSSIILDELISTTTTGAANESINVFGVAGRYLNIAYKRVAGLDLGATLNAITHGDRDYDINGLLMTNIRSAADDIYEKGGYDLALAELYPGQEITPTLVVTTSRRIASKLHEARRTEKTKDTYNWEVVVLPGELMEDQIFLTFNFGHNTSNDDFNLLNGMITGYGSELIYQVNLSKNGATSKDLSISGRWKVFMSAPVLAHITVVNWKGAVGKIA